VNYYLKEYYQEYLRENGRLENGFDYEG